MIKDILQHTHLFSSFNEKELNKFEQMAFISNLDSEQVLFFQGQEFNSFYYIVDGVIKLSRLSANGQEKIIDIIRSGNFFAEALLFRKSSDYPVQATAMTASKIVVIDSKGYFDQLTQSKDIMLDLLGTMSTRLHQLVYEIEAVTMQSTKSRLADYILKHLSQEKNNECILDLPKKIIASRLSMKPETFSRVLQSFEKQGIIKIVKNRISIKDSHALYMIINDNNI